MENGIMLQPKERLLGRYKVRQARYTQEGWTPRGPWLRLIVSDYRLIFMEEDAQGNPQWRAIPPHQIAGVWSVGLGRRDGGIIALHSGSLLYFYVEWSESRKLMQDIKAMMKPLIPRQGPAVVNKRHFQ
jgi:hypothetical protein